MIKNTLTDLVFILQDLAIFTNRLFHFQVSLPRNELVWVVEGEEGEEWWWVRSDQGRGGYFPANFLRVIDSPT